MRMHAELRNVWGNVCSLLLCKAVHMPSHGLIFRYPMGHASGAAAGTWMQTRRWCWARACSAANLSTTFRLRKFGMADGATYPVQYQARPVAGTRLLLQRVLCFRMAALQPDACSIAA